MEQQVEMFQSFGAENQKPPYKRNTKKESKVKTERPPTNNSKVKNGSPVRESFERKIVPLNANYVELVTGSITTSNGGDTPIADLVSSS